MRYFTITFQDLSFEKQQELLKEIKSDVLATMKEEGTAILEDETKDWYVRPRTWQEAYCREFAVDHRMWNDLDEHSQEFKDFCKNNNLEVFNVESINLSLYNLSKENKELKERLMEAGRYISYGVLDN